MLEASPSGELRQGDVTSVPFFPQWDFTKSFQIVGEDGIRALQMSAWSSVQKSEDGRDLVVICSHDCDVANPRQRTGILLAPIVKVSASPGDARFDQIMNSQSPSPEGLFTQIQVFPLVLPAGDIAVQAYAIDFSAMISVGCKDGAIPELLAHKLHEMNDATRKAFKTKLAAFVGRP